MDVYLDASKKSTALSDVARTRNKLKTGSFTIDSPFSPEEIRDNMSYLKLNSEEIEMTERYKYRPEVVSFDFYGTTNLWYIILMVNGVRTPEEFTMSVITVPYREAIFHILKKIKPKKVDILV